MIAEDSVLLREGITRLLVDAGEEVVAGFGDADALVGRLGRDQPDLVVLDVRMPPTHTDEGVRAALQIREPLAASGSWCCRSTWRSGTRASCISGDVGEVRGLPAQGPRRRRA